MRSAPSKPINVGMLEELLAPGKGNIVASLYEAPDNSALSRLAAELNEVRERYAFMQQSGNKARPLATRVQNALTDLQEFFSARAEELHRTSPGIEIVVGEMMLRAKFDS